MTRRLFDVVTNACTDWPDNGHLLESIVDLGYLDPVSDLVLDVTYGEAVWWSQVKPHRLEAHDLHTLDGVDFRHLPEPDGYADVVCFDPPYIPQGGTEHPQIERFRGRYGLDQGPKTRRELEHLVLEGFAECCRVVRKGGYVLVKCQPYQAGKIFCHMPSLVIAAGADNGVRLVDELIHRRRSGPTSADGFHHSRSNRSNMLVFRRVRRRTTAKYQ